MLLLAVVDTLFLCFSILTFSLPHLSDKYAEYHWMLLVPYTLPMAQVTLNSVLQENASNIGLIDVLDSQCLHDCVSDRRKILFCGASSLSTSEQVIMTDSLTLCVHYTSNIEIDI